MVSQVNGKFASRDKGMASYLKKVMESLTSFEKFELTKIPKVDNVHVDALSKLASRKDSELFKVAPIEHLSRPSISKRRKGVMWIKGAPLSINQSPSSLKVKCYQMTRRRPTNSGIGPPSIFYKMKCFTR